jgi:hypothetical protein
MADRSPQKHSTKRVGKSLKAKRVAKKGKKAQRVVKVPAP